MKRRILVLPLVLLALLLATGTAFAQDTPAAATSDVGWWVGGGGGYLAGRADCTNCEITPDYGNGGAFIVQGGVRARDRLSVGGEVYSTNRRLPAGSFRNTHMLAVFQYRPITKLGWFLKGGYGMAIVKGVVPAEDGVATTTGRTWGMAVMYGTGWEFKVARRVSFAPLAATYITTVGDVTTTQGVANNVVVNGWFAGALLVVH